MHRECESNCAYPDCECGATDHSSSLVLRDGCVLQKTNAKTSAELSHRISGDCPSQAISKSMTAVEASSFRSVFKEGWLRLNKKSRSLAAQTGAKREPDRAK